MHLRQLQIFRAVMASGTTTGAALSLGVSQPAVSRALANAEDVLGLRLFERNSGRLVATEEATQLYNEIEPLFLALEATRSRVHDIREGRTGNVRIVANSSLATSVLPSAVHAIVAKTPNVTISIDIQNWDRAAEQIEANIADVGLSFTVRDRPNVTVKPLYLGKMVCVLPKDHPLNANAVIRPGDMHGQRLIRLSPDSPLGELITGPLDSSGIESNAVVQTRYCNMVCALVQSGAGIGIVDEFVVSSINYPGLAVRPFFPTIQLTAYALLPKDRPMSHLTKRVIKELEEVFLKLVERGAIPDQRGSIGGGENQEGTASTKKTYDVELAAGSHVDAGDV